jgi:uncharacterized membrane protein
MPKNPTLSMPVRALVLGAMGGARSFTPLGVLALQHGRPSLAGAWQGWPVFRSPVGRGLLMAGAVGELVGDKLPRTPSRVGALPLTGRVVAGAVVGLALGSTDGGLDRRVRGAVFGAVGAVIGSYAGYLARKRATEATGLPDAVFAVVEDAVALTGTALVLTAD